MTTAACISLLRVFVAAIVIATTSKSYAFGGRVHGLWSLCSLSVCEWLCECKLCAWASHLAMCVLRMRAAEGGWVGGWVGERVGGWWFCVAFVWRLCVAALRGCFACGLCARLESRTKCIATRDNHLSESRTPWHGVDSAVRLQKQRAAIAAIEARCRESRRSGAQQAWEPGRGHDSAWRETWRPLHDRKCVGIAAVASHTTRERLQQL